MNRFVRFPIGKTVSNCHSRHIQTRAGLPKQQVLIVGCGVAGNSAALRLANAGKKVLMLSSAQNPLDCNSYWAQGGIIYKSPDDSVALLSSDIHAAGAGVSYDPAVKELCRKGPKNVEELLLEQCKVPFQKEQDDKLSLTLEASHNRARIIYKGDYTGKTITTSMVETVESHPNIELLTNQNVFELIQDEIGAACQGVKVFDQTTNEIRRIYSNMTLLATGGLGDLYLNTSNPLAAKGEGVGLASRAGAKLRNMEYVQFHPTTLYLPGERSFLLTEALRGEGGILLDHSGRAFAKDYHKLGELAPRDVVARMILSEMAKTNQPHMYLDISFKDSKWLAERFPSIYEHCVSRGIDFTKTPLPVVPAAHYHCGGIHVDLHGRTTIKNLYAAGEVACTGLHGANRLASTSLLEGLVWGSNVADHFLQNEPNEINPDTAMDTEEYQRNLPKVPSEKIAEIWAKSREMMWNHVGPVRTPDQLAFAEEELSKMVDEVSHLYATHQITVEMNVLRNGLHASLEISKAALRNTTSVGTHYLHEEEEEELVAASAL